MTVARGFCLILGRTESYNGIFARLQEPHTQQHQTLCLFQGLKVQTCQRQKGQTWLQKLTLDLILLLFKKKKKKALVIERKEKERERNCLFLLNGLSLQPIPSGIPPTPFIVICLSSAILTNFEFLTL